MPPPSAISHQSTVHCVKKITVSQDDIMDDVTDDKTRIITVFSAYAYVAKSLRSGVSSISTSTAPSIQDVPRIVEIEDVELSNNEGIVQFDPRKLSLETITKLQESEILVTEPHVFSAILHHDGNLQKTFPNLKWCQFTFAGVDTLKSSSQDLLLQSNITLTRFAGKCGIPMAEWCIGRIIAHERQFDDTHQDQRQQKWRVTSYRLLSDLTMVILGCGDIGSCIAKAAKAMGMTTVGYVRRTLPTRLHFDSCTTNLSEALSQADYIVSVLPSTNETRGLLNHDKLKACINSTTSQEDEKVQERQPPVFINVGRGDIIEDGHLLQALDKQYISAAILDVFAAEPLPSTSPLWNHPKVTISPHNSGYTRAADVPDLVMNNYKRYIEGKPLLYKVDFEKMY